MAPTETPAEAPTQAAEGKEAGAGGQAGAPAAGADAGPPAAAAAGAAPAAPEGGEAQGGGEAEGEAEMEARLAAAGGGSPAEAAPMESAAEAEETESPGGPGVEEDKEEAAAASALLPPEQRGEEGSGAAGSGGVGGAVESAAAPTGPPPALVAAEGEADAAVREDRAAEEAEAQAETQAEERAGQAVPAGLAPGLADVAPEPETAAEGPAETASDTGPESPAEPAATPEGGEALTPAERGVALSALSEGAGGGGEGGGGGGGGGAVPDEPEPEVPDLSAADPQSAMGTLASLPPGAAVQALGGVSTSIGTSVGAERESLAASPPEVPRSYGLAPTQTGAAEAAAAAPVAEPTPPVVETPTGPVVPVPAPEPVPTPPPSPAESVPAPRVTGGGERGEVTEDDAARLRDSVDDLPTRDSGLSTDAGPPPALELAGDADPGQMASQEAELDRTMAQARAQGARDAAVPMGENRILPRRAEGPATLRATIPTGGGAAGGGAGAGGGAPPEAAAIVAREQSGAELAAAARTAQTDMASRQSEHRTRIAAEKAKTDGEIAGLEGAAATAQAGEQQRAQGEVQGLRGEWSTAQTEAVEQRSGEAETARAEGDTAVADARTTGESEAAGHIETGESEAGDARAEGESEAAAEKAKAKEESSGVFGWLASKAKAFFDGIKKGIQKAFEKARAAVKAAIEKAKKLAVAAIEKARSAIVAAIRKVGDALIAIGDKLLADFPALRDRFRKAIQEKVAAAEAAVNRIADGLKEGVQKALDALGGALDAALGLLEKGLLAVVDAYSAAVQGVLKAAQAVADAVGMFAALIKDVAAGPGQWIANLASGVMDGIKNHLWTALKNAVKNWFNQKVEEVLGLGTALWGLLTKGGIALAEIGKMAWEALKAAIPPTLIQLLIEKLVSMVVPAAGAVMAIIEGLQAAWGTVSRIIAAFGAFFVFLKAVKPGTAGPPFAAALAAGAVVVIDFVANWLLRRLRKPAGKVAGKLKAIGKKILAKLKKAAKKVGRKLKAAAKKIGRKLKAAGRKIKEKLSRKKKGAKGKRKAKPEKKSKQEKAQERLRKAVAAIRPQLQRMLAKGKTSGLLVRARLAAWRVRWRLSKLALEGSGDRPKVVARVNPSEDVLAFVRKHGGALRKIIYDVAREIFARPDVQAAMAKHQAALAEGRGSAESPLEANTAAESVALSQVLSGRRPASTTHVAFAGGGRAAVSRRWRKKDQSEPVPPGLQLVHKGGSYEEHSVLFGKVAAQEGKGVSALQSSANITQLGGGSPFHSQSQRDFAAQQALLKIVEMSRSGQAAVVTMEQAQQVGTARMTLGEGIAGDPMTHKGAVRQGETLERRTMSHKGEGDVKTRAKVQKAMIEQQIRYIATVMEARYGAQNIMFKDEHGLTEAVRNDVKKAVKERTEQNLGLVPVGNLPPGGSH